MLAAPQRLSLVSTRPGSVLMTSVEADRGDVDWKLSGDPNSVPGFPPAARGQSSSHDFCRGDVNWKLLTSLLSDVTS